MKTILVDDEELDLRMLEYILGKVQDIELAGSFTESEEALKYVRSNSVDLVFLDVEMPEISGVEFARLLKEDAEQGKHTPLIIFVTAHQQYSMDAWRVEAVDYVLKPYEADSILHAVNRARRLMPENNAGPQIAIRCFPSFDLILDGQPYSFRSRKAKELLAYLVHSRGNWCTISEMTYALFEDADEETSYNYLRQLLHRLRNELKKIGAESMLVTDYGRARAALEEFPCDYLDYIKGNTSLFQGDFMREYSWAEATQAIMMLKLG